MTKITKTCSNPACNHSVYARKLCMHHYNIWLSQRQKSKKANKSPKPKEKSLKRNYKAPRRIDYNCSNEELYEYKSSDLKKICYYWLRQKKIRDSRIANQGRLVCFITGKSYKEEDLHVAHLIPRTRQSTTFDTINCNLVNKWSNTFDDQIYDKELYGIGCSKHIYEYTAAFIRHYGEDRLSKLKELSRQRILRTKEDLIKLIVEFREFIK